MSLLEFQNRVVNDLLPLYCHGKSGYEESGFDGNYSKLHDFDARDCLRALDCGLVSHVARGLYCIIGAKKQGYPFFWEGSRADVPRTLTLWIEAIITLATAARLHLDYHWPAALLQTESMDGAFDLTAYLPSNLQNEFIACEIKKTKAEFNNLIASIVKLGMLNPDHIIAVKERNAYRKLSALRSRHAPVLWIVGPGGLNKVFWPSYKECGLVTFQEVANTELRYRTSPWN